MQSIGFLFCAFTYESAAFNAMMQNKKANPSGWPFACICGSGEIRTLVQIRNKEAFYTFRKNLVFDRQQVFFRTNCRLSH